MDNKKSLLICIAAAFLLIAAGLLIRGFAVNRENKIIAAHIGDYMEERLGRKTGRKNQESGALLETENSFLLDTKAATISDEITELILSHTQIQIVKASSQTCILAVTSPDCARIYRNILESSSEWDKTDFASSKAYVLERFLQELKDPSLPCLTREAELKVVKNGEQYELVETEEYLDALYGGLVTYYKELSAAIQEEGK